MAILGKPSFSYMVIFNKSLIYPQAGIGFNNGCAFRETFPSRSDSAPLAVTKGSPAVRSKRKLSTTTGD